MAMKKWSALGHALNLKPTNITLVSYSWCMCSFYEERTERITKCLVNARGSIL